jgi:prepilin signal peptidase PulO-like enzyme (type II secretory pathway)
LKKIYKKRDLRIVSFFLDFLRASVYFIYMRGDLIIFVIFIVFAVPISIVDVRERRIPDSLSVPCFLFMLLARLFIAPETLPPSLWASAAALLLFALIRLSAGGLGMGDLKLAALLGLACSFPRFITALLAASLLGLAGVLPLLIRGEGRKFALPFAPFLCAGAVLAEFYGYLPLPLFFLNRI